jgi:predicted PurR-regulated permease PerM
MNEFYRALPNYQRMLETQVQTARNWLVRDVGIELPRGMLGQSFSPGSIMQLAGSVLSSLGGLLTDTFVILLTVIFMLLEASTFPRKFRAIWASPGLSFNGFQEVAQTVNRYLAIKTFASLLTGVAATVWLTILGVDFAVLWGLLAFFLNYIPNIGSFIAVIPPALLSLVQLGPWSTLMVVAGFAVINAVVGNFIEIRLLGRSLGLSTLVVLISLLVWQWVLGPVGMLLSVPLTMTLKIALEAHEETRWVAILLGSGGEISRDTQGETQDD